MSTCEDPKNRFTPIETLGRIYDIKYVNPLQPSKAVNMLGGGLNTINIFDYTSEEIEWKPDEKLGKCIPSFSNADRDTSFEQNYLEKEQSSRDEFRSIFKANVSGEVSYFLASASFGTSYEHDWLGTHESTDKCFYGSIKFERQHVSLNNPYEKYPLTSTFRQLVKDLNPYDQKLASYFRLIRAVGGTHVLAQGTYGGMAYILKFYQEATYKQLQKEKVDVEAGIKALLGKVGGGVKGGMSKDELQSIERKAKISIDSIKCVGGKHQSDLEQWKQSIENDESLSLVHISLWRISELLTDKNFPDDDAIERKKRI